MRPFLIEDRGGLPLSTRMRKQEAHNVHSWHER